VRKLLALGARADEEGIGARYRLVRELGRGGMGVVYEAEDLELKRRVALKLLPEGEESAELRARFAREAAAAARLAHPHIVAIYDATPRCIVMQLVEGRPLSELRGADRRLVVALVRDAARAVHHAHVQGIVHRDLKPSNLLVTADHVWVADFGLAKQAGAATSLSTSGSLLGTPEFMAPEQAAGRHEGVDARTDVWGLGATLYAALAGRPPFVEPDLVRLLRRIAEDEPEPPRVERDLDVVILKCLAKAPGERYAGAADLADDLDRWLRGEPIRARPPSATYRLRKLVARHRRLLQASAAAVLVTGLALLPSMLRARSEGARAQAALRLVSRAGALLSDAEAARRAGELGRANELLEQGIRAADEFLAREQAASAHQLRGRLLRARGRVDAARAAFDRALALDPALPGVRFERGLLLADVDREQALADLLAERPESLGLREVERLFGEAERARLEGEPSRARLLLEEVRRLDPGHLGAPLSLARIALEQGDDELALEYAIHAVNLQRPAATVHRIEISSK
jgi:serine/threonine-protein kinase